MKALLLVGIFFSISMISFAQKDTVMVDSVLYVKFDVVHFKGQAPVRGEITSFDTNSGLVVIIDEYGEMHSYTPLQYSSFEYDKLYKVRGQRKRSAKELLPRKENEFQFTVGLKPAWKSIRLDFTPDDYYVNALDGTAQVPILLTLGVGKYFTRRHYAGVNLDFAIFSLSGGSYFNFGGRYCYQYDGGKGNTALYVPVELKYNRYADNMRFTVNDTTDLFGNGPTYPGDLDLDYTLNTFGFTIGQGFAFMMNNKKSIALELFVSKDFILSEKYEGTDADDPKIDYTLSGFGFSVALNF